MPKQDIEMEILLTIGSRRKRKRIHLQTGAGPCIWIRSNDPKRNGAFDTGCKKWAPRDFHPVPAHRYTMYNFTYCPYCGRKIQIGETTK